MYKNISISYIYCGVAKTFKHLRKIKCNEHKTSSDVIIKGF